MPPEDDDPPEKPKRPPPPPLRPSVRAFLSRKDVTKWVHDRVRGKVAARHCEEVAQSAMQEAVEDAVWPEADADAEEKVLWATLLTVVDRVVADHLERRKRRRKYEGDMPAAPTRQDEVGRHVPDEDAVADDAADPRAEDLRVEGVLMRRYLSQAIAGNERDEQTYRWMVENNDEEVTYEEIAARTGIPLGTVHSRVRDFKERYLPRYTRWRNNAVLLLLLLVMGAVAIVAARWPRAQKVEDIQPAHDFKWPPPASTSAAPVPPGPPPSFDNALPTQPPPELKP